MKKSGIVISILIFIIFILIFCFIYFSGILALNKNAKSEWDVSIVNIQSKNQIGDAANDSAPVYDKTTATFKTLLTSPGDSITYDITIKNKGKIDAKLNKIIMGETTSSDIVAEISGVKEGQILKAGQSHYAHVVISYDKSASKKSEILKSSLSVKLDYIKM